MAENIIDQLNRSAKLFIDRKSASTVDEAIEKLSAFRMHLFMDAAAASSPTQQAALLTALNCGRRTFLGGVTVSGALDLPLLSKVAPGTTISDAVRHLKGKVTGEIPEGVPLVSFGPPPAGAQTTPLIIRATFDGWRGGIIPVNGAALPEVVEFTPSGVLAGALAAAEVFAYFDGDVMAGNRATGLSLWDPSPSADWRFQASDGPTPSALPADFWLIGLGHLGQAFLWTIGLLNFTTPSDVRIFLQDNDVAGKSTESTSVLTFEGDVGKLKTRICARWAEACGFTTRLIERRFEADFRVGHGEPLLAVCGVDNPQARAIIEGAGFAAIFEAGLGNGPEDFRLIRTHSFPAPVQAVDIWADDEPSIKIDGEHNEGLSQNLPPAYADLRNRGELDECGLTRLAEVAVGASFVGNVTSAVLISQIIRMIVDGSRPTVFNLDLSAVQHRSVVWQNNRDIVVFGSTAASQFER